MSIAEAHPGAAEGTAREVRDAFQAGRKTDDQIIATTTLVDALLADGKHAEALKEVGKTRAIAARSQNLDVQLGFAAAMGRAEAASKETVAAEKTLKQVLAKATRSGYIGYQFESRLALEEIEVKSGKSSASRVRIEQLQREAHEKGYEMIARKAAAL